MGVKHGSIKDLLLNRKSKSIVLTSTANGEEVEEIKDKNIDKDSKAEGQDELNQEITKEHKDTKRNKLLCKLDKEIGNLIKEKNNRIYLIYTLLLPLSVIYYEWIFHGFTFQTMNNNILFPLLLSIPIGMIAGFLIQLFKSRIQKIVIVVLVSFLFILYSGQLLYYSIFKRFLSLYSIGAVGMDALDYMDVFLTAIGENIGKLFIFMIPFVVTILIIAKYSVTNRKSIKFNLSMCTSSLILYGLVVLMLPIGGKELYSPYDLYHNTWVQEMSVEELGLLTATRRNIIDLIFDESTEETIDTAILITPTNLPITMVADSNVDVEDKSDVDSNVSEPAITVVPTPIPIDSSPNILEIDFLELAKKEENKQVKALHEYFATETPTNKNEYTGMFKGYNLILLTAEGFSPYAVDKDVTPTLYKLVNEGFVFENFYTPLWWASTIDGEYVACTGLIPKQGVISFNKSSENTLPFAFGNQFNKLGYTTRAYHNHTYTYYKRDKSHPNLGYDYKGVGNGLEVKQTWPESDLEMMELTIPEYINDEAFHTYYMTVSGHMNYTFIGNSMSTKNKDAVENLPYSMESKAYIACNIELDLALEKLIAELDTKGILDKTVIALSADHYPYGLEKDKIDELAGHVVEENFELYKNHFILWSNSIEEPIIIEKPASSLDIAPTLSNLFGLPYDSRLYAGRDILSDSSPLVIFSNRSFITDKVSYNSKTKEVIQFTEEELPVDYIKVMNSIVKNKFLISEKILEEDYYSYILDYLSHNPIYRQFN